MVQELKSAKPRVVISPGLCMSHKYLKKNLTPKELEACGHVFLDGIGFIHRSKLPSLAQLEAIQKVLDKRGSQAALRYIKLFFGDIVVNPSSKTFLQHILAVIR